MHHLNLEKSIKAFADFLKKDNELLQAFQEKEVLKRAPSKEVLIDSYTNAYHLFKKDEAACKALPKETKENLIQQVRNLEALTQENFRLIRRTLGAHEFYLKTLTRLTCERVSPQVEGYSALGRHKGRRTPLPAMSLSQYT